MELRIRNNLQWAVEGALLMESSGEHKDAFSYFKLIFEALKVAL